MSCSRSNLVFLLLHLVLPLGFWGQAPGPTPVETAEEELMAQLDLGCTEARRFAQGFAAAPSSETPDFRRAMGELLQGLFVSYRLMNNASANPNAHFQAALQLAELHRWPVLAARAQIGLAREYLSSDRPDSVVVWLQQAENRLNEQPSHLYRAELDKIYAIVFGTMADTAKAFAHLSNGLRTLDRLTPDRAVWRAKARLLHNRGILEHRCGLFKAAKKSLEQALEIRLREGFRMEIPINQGALANAAFSLEQKTEALELIDQAERNSRDSCLAKFRSSILIDYAKFANEKGDYRKALEIAREMEWLGRKIGALANVQDALLIQSQAHELLGDYREANRILKIENALKDSLYNEKMVLKISELDAVKTQKEKEKELAQLNIDFQKRRDAMLLLGVATVLVCLLLAVSVLYAISRKKANHTLTEQAIELANANQTKERLFSIMAHDLRSPLQSLSALIDQWDRLQEIGLDVNRTKRQIQQQVADTGYLLDNLLLWASRDKQQLVAKTAHMDLAAVLEEECRLQGEEARLHRCTVVFRPDLRPSVMADANMIRFVVRNLVSNALKFSPENETVTVTIDSSEMTGMVRVGVRDNGPGFPPSVLSALRSPLEKFEKKGSYSHGLGLTLSRSFLAQHGAELHIETPPGKGAFLWFDLPEIKIP